MAFRFEDLKVWQKALHLSNEIDLIAKSFPKIEMFSLAQQIKRAADSIVLNIAEGSTGQTVPEYKRFLGFALRSGYLSDDDFKKYYAEYEILCKMITSLKNSM